MIYSKKAWSHSDDPYESFLTGEMITPAPKEYVTRSISLGALWFKWTEPLTLDALAVTRKDARRPAKSDRTPVGEKLRKNLKDSRRVSVHWCIPCGHVSIYSGHNNQPRKYRFSLKAFSKPEYAGDCKYIYINLPIRMYKYFGLEGAYKRYAPWDK